MGELRFATAIERLGTESAFVVLARAQALMAAGRNIINLGIGQPDFKTPAHIVEAGIKALEDGHHGYTPANGLPQLREAVAEYLEKRYNVSVDPNHVIVVPGGKPSMFFAVMMFGEPGAEILYPNPGFPIYESVIRYSGATPIAISLNEEAGFSLSAKEALAKINSKTRLIIVNSPSNPTGGVIEEAELDALATGLEKHPHVAILSDEIYSHMLYDGRRHKSLLSYPKLRNRVIMLDGWSKTFAMTGWRIGYAVWPESMVESVTRLCVNDHSCVNASAQFAALAALNGPKDEVLQMIESFDQRRKVMVEALNDLPYVSCRNAAGAFYAFANISETGLSSKAAQDLFLEKAGVATISGTSFGSNGEGFVRFSYANSNENILRAIDRIRQSLSL
ncbi:MAG: aspartate aminotransferase [Rhodobacteraceae bacterium]|nr:aspartate aminotransferase [Paracoccaceae bacterium]